MNELDVFAVCLLFSASRCIPSHVATHTPEVHADCVSQVNGLDLLPLVQLLNCHSCSRQTAKCVS